MKLQLPASTPTTNRRYATVGDSPTKLKGIPAIAAALSIALTVWLLRLLLPSPSRDEVGMFGRVDVLICAALCATPFSKLIADRLATGTRARTAAIAIGLVAIASALLWFAATLSLVDASGELELVFWRGLVVISAVTAALMMSNLFFGQLPSFETEAPHWILSLTLLALAIVVPTAYADAVAKGLRSELQKSLEEQRLALAERQAGELRQLKPHWAIHDTPIQRLQRELKNAVSHLRAESADPLPRAAPLATIGRRITILVQLERFREALRLAESLTQANQLNATALDYCGLCYQRLEQPRESLAAYRRAVGYWDSQPAGDAQQRGLVSALKGVAFAARRLDNRSLEEQTYRRLVETSPSAESHMLMAQCYREHQKTSLAASHATTAMELDPHYQEQAASILTSISRDHFGCLQIPK